MPKHAGIFFLTDFGSVDPFVGIMKAVAIGLGHEGPLIDLTHDIDPGDVRRGSILMEDAMPSLPSGSVVCVVIDPGVGTARRAIVVETPGGVYCVGPDNGVLASAIQEEGSRVREIEDTGASTTPKSATFHGRDVFAPAAALIASGQKYFADVGPEISDAIHLEFPKPIISGGKISLQVISSDRFGNLTTNLRREEVDEDMGLDAGEFSIAGRSLGPLRKTFGDVAPGKPLIYFNAFGRLEVAINGSSARDYFMVKPGARVEFLAGTIK